MNAARNPAQAVTRALEAQAAAALRRRDFLKASVALGGGLLIAFRWPGSAQAAEAAAGNAGAGGAVGAVGAPGANARAADFVPNAFVRIAPDGRVTVLVNKAEMGQGVCTSLAMLLAEELDADWSRVGFEFAPAAEAYKDPAFHMQMTGGSTSVANMSEPLRHAGATARAMLLAAAGKAWSCHAAECRTEPGVVVHPASGRRATYGDLGTAAAGLAVPADVPLKATADFRLIGKPTRRLDTPEKIAGTAIFGIDVQRPGMLVAVVAHPPVFHGRVKKLNAEATLALPGVKQVVPIDNGVAVVATGFWAAKRGRDLLQVEWDPEVDPSLSSAALHESYRQLSRTPGLVARKEGDAAAALAGAARRLEADYELPYLAHATMEPLNCVVDLRKDACDIWLGTQFQTVDQANAAKAAGLAPEQVAIHTTFLGGGFGRRANPVSDYVVEGVQIARAVGVPVKLIWTREDDMRGGYYRPLWHNRLSAGLDARGALTAWSHTIVGQSIVEGTPFAAMMVKDGIDSTSVEGADDTPYAILNLQVELHTTKPNVPTQWWRSVGHSHTAFAVESFLDEIAHATGEDPVALRRRLLAGKARWLGVLELVAQKSGWGKPAPAGRARGFALHHSFSSWVAHVAEVSVQDGRPRVHRVTSAVDCGLVVNPDTVIAQVQSAVGFALAATLYGAITLKDGRVEQGNFHDYRMLRIHEMPETEVHLVPSTEKSSGIGEPGVPPVAPAVCNALFALTGKRIRRLPIRPEDLSAEGGAR
ncbi:MAG TPA: xanthine dehydrogenase family protein molybdopterin-binding subunit [Planctomycetota bacterium]|nr:xanthine dehydrogenase family protein molybdopterin-binding subunit [Planctomycetota bacterium]